MADGDPGFEARLSRENTNMNEPVSPASIAPPAANYHHGVVATASTRLLHTSGVVPTAPDGSVPEDLAAQAEVVWTNIAAIVEGAGLAMSDIVSVTTYVVMGSDLSVVMAARDRALDGHRAASTLVYVPALARREWKMEVAVVAAR
jgi:2-iminobutanoate/2-iminopropanoate deaminase